MDVLGVPQAHRGSTPGGPFGGAGAYRTKPVLLRRRGDPLKPFDPKLLRRVPPARRSLMLTAVASIADAALLVVAAGLLASIIAAVVTDGASLTAVSTLLATFLLVVGARSALGWAGATLPQKAAASVKYELRSQVISAAVSLGRGGDGGSSSPRLARSSLAFTPDHTPDDPPSPPLTDQPAEARPATAGEITAIAGRGLDALDPYFARYVPELIRAATVPVAVLIALFSRDLTTGMIVLLTLPLIPVFGALVGMYTERRMRRQWRLLAVLSHHFLDVVRGLPTLKVFGRAQAQAGTIARVTEQHRIATMATLRIAMLSALVLEVAATISVALVAVSVGFRLVYGELDLEVALFLLILAPEAYLPLRRSAAEYHSATQGIAAAERAFELIDAERTGPRAHHRPAGRLTLEQVTVRFPGREAPALDRLDLTIPPGKVTAVVGPSGSGKSTLLRVLIGLQPPGSGRVRVGATDLSAVDLAAWHRGLAWLPQRPHLVAGTVADNIRLGRLDATDSEVRTAARRAFAAPFIEALPAGYATPLGESGAGLSEGQRQRIALARVFLRTEATLVLLDEPTAHLDTQTEAVVSASLAELAIGRTVVIVTHRPALLDLADGIVELSFALPVRADRSPEPAGRVNGRVP
ncbi:MAG TPA: thiol reductant ABC exporter subunit CydD [Jiangellaceae bacterium]